jgi:hypothetical protein
MGGHYGTRSGTAAIYAAQFAAAEILKHSEMATGFCFG